MEQETNMIVMIDDTFSTTAKLKRDCYLAKIDCLIFASYAEFGLWMVRDRYAFVGSDVVVLDAHIKNEGTLAESLETDFMWQQNLWHLRRAKFILHTGSSRTSTEMKLLKEMGFSAIDVQKGSNLLTFFPDDTQGDKNDKAS